ncbi:MAG: Arc family DNA-binding protein [Thiothrix sp.]|nr:MAG: Arc family DNA-binding protein [Thiothrix sp.]
MKKKLDKRQFDKNGKPKRLCTNIRIPLDFSDALKESADHNFRSLNAEILYLLQIGMSRAQQHATPEEIRQIVREELKRVSNK